MSKWASVYGTAINRGYFRQLAMIRHYPEKARYHKGWATRYRNQALSKRWEIKAKGKPMKEMVGKAIRQPPKEQYEVAETPTELTKKVHEKEVWIWRKERFTD